MGDDDLYFSVGQAARELGETPAKIRALCEAGLIEGERRTPGGHLRLSVKSVERYKTEGLPALPHSLPDSDRGSSISNATAARRNHGRLLGKPSPSLIDSAEEVVRLKHKLEATQLRRQIAEEEDRIAEPVISAIKNIFKGQLQRQSELIAERPKILREFDRKLALDDETLQRKKIERQQSESREAVEWEILWRLPSELRNSSEWLWTDLKQRATQAATAAVSEIPTASLYDKKKAAGKALQGFVREYEHKKHVIDIIDGLPRHLPGATDDELNSTGKTIASALLPLPDATPRDQMERVRDQLLAPLRERIAKRQ